MYMGDLNPQTNQRSKPDNVPAPVGGLNRRDALASMPATDAYIFENLMPGTTSVSLRLGCTQYQEGLGPPVTSLVTYISGKKEVMFGLLATTLYDMSVKDDLIEAKTGISGDDIQSIMFSNAADNAQWLICTTGNDNPFAYNGTDWSNLTITYTGITASPNFLNYVCPYKGRLYWAYKDVCGFFYLPPGAIQGEVEFYDLGQIAHKGGAVVCIATFSEDAGDGPNQYIVFITDEGEYIMYAGEDPGDAASWELIGRYTYAPPIGRHAVCDYAGDLLVMTQNGVMQLSQIRKLADTRSELVTLSSKLGDTFEKHVQYDTMYGWNIILYPKGGIIQATIPEGFAPSAGFTNYVMNTTTQAWTTVLSKEWNGICWTIFHDQLYYGRVDGTVRRAYDGDNDCGQAIVTRVCQAYNYFGNSQNKQFKWVECLVACEVYPPLSGVINVNFHQLPVGPIEPVALTDLGATWDISYWDADFWAVEKVPMAFIVTYQNFGFVGSLCLHGSFKGMTFEWYSSKWVYEIAEGLL